MWTEEGCTSCLLNWLCLSSDLTELGVAVTGIVAVSLWISAGGSLKWQQETINHYNNDCSDGDDNNAGSRLEWIIQIYNFVLSTTWNQLPDRIKTFNTMPQPAAAPWSSGVQLSESWAEYLLRVLWLYLFWINVASASAGLFSERLSALRQAMRAFWLVMAN